MIQEKNAGNTVTDRQVHGYAPIASVGDIAVLDKSGTAYVPVSDQVGTIWDLLNSSAGVANSYEYDAFGVDRGVDETVTNRYRFGTKRLDADTDLYHFIARQYEARIGGFLARETQTGYGQFDDAGTRFANGPLALLLASPWPTVSSAGDAVPEAGRSQTCLSN